MSDTPVSTLSTDQVLRIAQLANLPLTDQETTLFQGQLANIFGYVNQLQQVDTTGVKETSQVTGLHNVSTIDQQAQVQTLSQQEALANAKSTHDGYIAVNQLIDKE